MKHVTLNFEENELAALDEFAEKEGLSRNGAVTHLLASALGGVVVPQVPVGNVRAAFAKQLLIQAQRYTGVHPVVVEGAELVKLDDPGAEQAKEEFYANKYVPPVVPQKVKRRDPLDQTPDDEDY